MTKEAALHQFWAGFGLPVYEENAVPKGQYAPEPPYITYQSVTDSIGHEVQLTGSVWSRGTSWLAPNAKAREISAAIGRGGKKIPCDGGIVWIKRGHPFAQNMGDPNDDGIKRKYINIAVEFATAD